MDPGAARRRWLGAWLAAILTLVPALARGAPIAANAAEALFRDGRARTEAGDYTHACPLFAESLRLDFALGTLLNLAACEERIGALASAWQHYAELARQLPADDDRLELARQRATSLDRIVPRLTLVLSSDSPTETQVTRDGSELHPVNLGVALPLDEGLHAVTVEAPGHASRHWDVRLSPGERRVLVVAPGEATAKDAPTAPGNGLRTTAWIVGGAGLASLTVGTVLGVRALMLRSESDALCSGNVCTGPDGPQAYDDAKTYSRAADVAIGLGIVAVATAGYLLLFPPSAEPAPRAAVRFGFSPSGLAGTW